MAHHFHASNPERDPERRARDDRETMQIDWPNYHSGRNGDWQRVQAAMPLHPILRREDGSAIEFLPAHPHEGAVSVPPGAEERARVLATGRSQTTGRHFNIAVAFEGDAPAAVARSATRRFIASPTTTGIRAPVPLTSSPSRWVTVSRLIPKLERTRGTTPSTLLAGWRASCDGTRGRCSHLRSWRGGAVAGQTTAFSAMSRNLLNFELRWRSRCSETHRSGRSRRRSSTSARGGQTSTAVGHQLATPTNIKGRSKVSLSADRSGATDP